jgi:DNA-directed RNA polymerase subunit omega
MARITIEDCTQRVGNRFGLVLMAAIRAKQLMRGARPLVRAGDNRPVVVALREVAAAHIRADLPEEPPVPTK